MAKFLYRMQNILEIKYKLEEQAKQNYMSVRARLDEALKELEEMKKRKQEYISHYRMLLLSDLDVLEIETGKEAILFMENEIYTQQIKIDRIEKELEQAIYEMNEAMKERKIHEKLKEKQFEQFQQELSREEMKEIDQLVSYQYNGQVSEGE